MPDLSQGLPLPARQLVDVGIELRPVTIGLLVTTEDVTRSPFTRVTDELRLNYDLARKLRAQLNALDLGDPIAINDVTAAGQLDHEPAGPELIEAVTAAVELGVPLAEVAAAARRSPAKVEELLAAHLAARQAVALAEVASIVELPERPPIAGADDLGLRLDELLAARRHATPDEEADLAIIDERIVAADRAGADLDQLVEASGYRRDAVRRVLKDARAAARAEAQVTDESRSAPPS